MRNQFVVVVLVLLTFSSLFLLDAYSETLNTPQPQAGSTGIVPVVHAPVVDARLYMSGGGSLTSPYVDYVEVTAYVTRTEDVGYYNVTIIVYFADTGQVYGASGTVYLSTTPVTLYFSIPATTQGSDTRIYAFAEWLGP